MSCFYTTPYLHIKIPLLFQWDKHEKRSLNCTKQNLPNSQHISFLQGSPETFCCLPQISLNMDRFSFSIGVIGNIISVLMFLSPVKTFWRIVKHKSTEEFESFPYICTLLSSSLWTYYGIIRPGSYLVATINGFGVVVEIVYVSLFLIFAPPKMKGKTATLAGILNVGFLAAAILVAHFLMSGETRIDVIGFMCSGLNILMFGSPLAAMKTVVRTKSAEYMPFLLSFFLFLNGGIWTFYALLVRDWFLAVPNGIGIILGATQLVLYAIYRNAKPRNSITTDLEEASQRHHLLGSSASTHTSEG